MAIHTLRKNIGQQVEIALDCAGSGAAVLLLHGVGGRRSQWTRQIRALSDQAAILAWDARGYGDSVGPSVVSMGDFADDLLRTLDALGLEKVLVVGHSMGGRIAMEAASRAPQRFAGVVLSGAQASYLAHMSDDERATYVASRRALFSDGAVPEDQAHAVAAQVLPSTASDASRAEVATDLAALRPEGYLAALAASAGWDRSSSLPNFEMPVTVLGGALDRICPPEECERIATLVGQGPAKILEGVGHMPHIEAPDQITALLRDFLTRHAPGASQIDTTLLRTENV